LLVKCEGTHLLHGTGNLADLVVAEPAAALTGDLDDLILARMRQSAGLD
jgi:hypothetical protein